MSYESKKNVHLQRHLGASFINQAWYGVKLSRLISIFTSKNVWKFLVKNQLTNSDPKMTGVESALPHANQGLQSGSLLPLLVDFWCNCRVIASPWKLKVKVSFLPKRFCFCCLCLYFVHTFFGCSTAFIDLYLSVF